MDSVRIPQVSVSVLERFSSKFRVAKDGCWLWNSTKTKRNNGYGQFSLEGKTRLAHRIIYVAFYGETDCKKEIDHLCRNRLCVNPRHLEEVSASENVRRGLGPQTLSELNKKRSSEQTHCKNGHEFTQENTSLFNQVSKNKLHVGMRRCKACHNVASRKHKAMLRKGTA